ncbi:hypothetical protein [Arvimicrobium flavum]|uniref:hypothetical protein n=1 Tax=Arvimicrobium flavum TaxID=3393320 RepID=UPI00237B8D7B|nr:hypothetical protein [Mesorhizobium shangrilense]
MKTFIVPAMLAGVVLVGTDQSRADTLNTMDDVGAAIQRCWTPPSGAPAGASVTLSFGIKRDGSLLGTPKPTAISVSGDEKARKSFVEAAVQAVEQCMPLQLSPALAQGIAGTVYTMQFTSPGN